MIKIAKLIIILVCLNSNNVFADKFINIETKQQGDIAVTLDACGGITDLRILNLLIEKNIPSTIFVTAKWIKKNKEAINLINKNKSIFSIQNHGFEHKEAVFKKVGAYNLPTVYNEEGLRKEVMLASDEIEKSFPAFQKPNWYRTAGALYDLKSLNWLKKNNWNVGGYTIAADDGGLASEEVIYKKISNAKPGDVLLIHMNKPHSHIYEGINRGLKALLEKQYRFSFLH